MSSSDHLVEGCRLREEMDQKVGFVARLMEFVEGVSDAVMICAPLNFVSEMFCFFVNFQIKEQKVAVDELSKLKKNRVGRRN